MRYEPGAAANSLIAALRFRASETEMLGCLPDATVGNLTASLKNGEPQNEINQGEGPFSQIYAEPARPKQFRCAMTGLSMGVAKALALQFP